MTNFWDRPLRIIQNNLRAIDAKDMDVEKLIATQAEYGTNVIICNAGGLLCWYDSKISHQPKNPYLDFDFVGEMIHHAHARGMKILLRLDVSNISEEDLKLHPDWAKRDGEGNPSTDLGMIQSCFYSPVWQEYNFALLEELLEKYDTDGIFYNAIHYGFCHCDNCKRIYREKTGRPLPDRLLTGSEEGKAFIRFRYREITEYFEKVRNFIHSHKPGAILAPVGSLASDFPEFNCFSGWDTVPYMQRSQDLQVSEAVDHARRPHPKYLYLAGDTARVANHMGKQSLICLHYTNTGRRTAQPPAQQAFNVIQSAAYGGSPALNISGTFELDDRKGLPALKSTYNYLEKNEKFYTGLRNRGTVGLVMSRKTLDFDLDRDLTAYSPVELMSKGSVSRHLAEYRGIYETLVHQHVLFNVIYDDNLETEDLSSYSLILLPGVTCMSDRQIKKLDAYVENGGRLIATGDAAASKDAEGRTRGDISLASLPYVTEKAYAYVGGYLAAEDKALWISFNETDWLGMIGKFARLAPKPGCDLVLRALNRIPESKSNKPEFAFTLETTDEYGLYVNRFGQGMAAVFPWDLGDGVRQARIIEYEHALLDVMHRLGWQRELETDAPYSCEVALADAAEGQLLHLINASGLQSSPMMDVIPLYNVTVKVETEAKSAISLVSGRALETTHENGVLKIKFDSVGLYEAAVLQ